MNYDTQTVQPKRGQIEICFQNISRSAQPCEGTVAAQAVKKHGGTFKDLTGKKFNKLTVISFHPREKDDTRARITRWNCVCDCGKQKVVAGIELTSGGTKSCGCIMVENIRKANSTHGLSGGPEYKTWLKMKERCLNKNAINYERYGGRGITVCERWMSFDNFFADMGKKPTPDHSIERKKNDAGYSPENCKWETRKVQCRNRRSSRILNVNGDEKTVAEWAEITGIGRSTIEHRIKIGWPPARAISEPATPFRPCSEEAKKKISATKKLKLYETTTEN